ncbi:MAG: hypothetical protein OEZ22_06695 [Spirochaetia bacterium]|nr:hypothetical protein [Spirochaetia bacterium]
MQFDKKIFSLFKLIIIFLIISPLFSQVKYPRNVDFNNTQLSKPKYYSNWLYYKKPDREHITIEIPNYFSSELALTLQLSEYFKNSYTITNSTIRIFKGKKQMILIENVPNYHFLSMKPKLEVFDFDNNGLDDFKFKFYSGGNSGHANVGTIYYIYSFKKYFELYSFYIRDIDYSWEADLNNDKKYEILIGHHADKEKPGFHDPNLDKWISTVHRKYLYINAFEFNKGGIMHSEYKKPFSHILVFDGKDAFIGKDVFDIYNDKEFILKNESIMPKEYYYKRVYTK